MLTLVVEITKEGDKLKLSAFEKSKSAEHTLRHYVESDVLFDEIDDLCDQVTNLLNKANRSGVLSDNLSDELRKIGQLLFDQLFPSEIKDKIRSTECKFLVLSIDEQLVQIPWELLHDGESFLSVKFASGRVVRTRQRFNQNKLRGVGSPINMLVVADPTGDLDSAYREGVNIRNDLEKKIKSIKIHLKTTDVDGQFLKKNIRDYDLVHFSGHAEYNLNDPSKSGWILKDERFTSKDIMSLGESGRFPMVVFSNACQTGMTKEWKIDDDFEGRIYGLANAFLLSGVKHYIGTFWRILDEPSSVFAKHFYQNILQDMPIGEAIRLARLKLIENYGNNSIVWASYMLYGDPSVSISSYYSAFESKQSKKSPLIRRKIVAFGLILFAILGVGLYQRSSQHLPLPIPILSEAPKNSLAIIPFTNLNKDQDSNWLSVGFTNGVGSKIYGSKNINLIGRDLIENKQKEMNLPPGQGLDPVSADKASRMFGANWMLLGDYQKIGDQIRVSVRLVDLRSGQDTASTQIEGPVGDLFKLQDKIALFIIEKINNRISEEDKKRISSLTSSDNVTAYEYMSKAAGAFNQNDYEKAKDYCNQALIVDPNYFEAIHGLGFISERLGNKTEAMGLYSKALEIAKKKSDKFKLMSAYFSLGNLNLSLSQADQAIENLKKSLNTIREVKDARSEASVLNSLSRAYLMKQDYKKAKEFAAQSEIIAKNYMDQSLLALIDMTYGFIYSFGPDSDFDRALSYFEKAQDFYKGSNNQQGQTLACQQIARLKAQKGDFEGALNTAGIALVSNQQIKDRAAEATIYQLLASIYQTKGEFGKSIEYYEKSLVINKEIGNAIGYKSDLYSLALANSIQTNFEKSLEYSTTLFEESKKSSDYDTAILALDQMASIHKLRGNYTEALNLYTEALLLLDETKNKFLSIRIDQGLGETYSRLGKLKESEIAFKNAVKIAEETKDPATIAHVYNDLGRYYQDNKNYAEAIDFHSKAIELIERLPANQRNNHDLVSSYFGIAQSLKATKEQKKSDVFFEKALILAQKINSPLLPSIKSNKSGFLNDSNFTEDVIQNKEAATLYDLAVHKGIEGKSSEAIGLMLKALSLNGPNEKILSGLCLEYQRMGNYAEAIKTSASLINYYQKKNDTEQLVQQYCWQGHMEYKLLNYKQAVALFDKAEKLALETNYKRGLVLVYADSSEIYESQDKPEKAIELANKAIHIADEISDPRYLGNAYQTLSIVYSAKGEHDKAIEYSMKDLELNEMTGSGDLGRTYAQLARAYKKVDVLKATEYFSKAIEYFEKKHDEQAKGNMLNELGAIYQDAHQNEKALDYYKRSIEIAERYNDKWTASASYIGLISLFNDMSKPELAEEYENKFIQNINATHDQKKVGIFIGLLGDQKLKSDPHKSLEYFQKSSQILNLYLDDQSARERTGRNYVGQALIEIGEDNLAQAEATFIRANKIMEKSNDKEKFETYTYTELATVYEKKKNFEKAKEYYYKLLDIFKKSNDKKGQAVLYFSIAMAEGNLKHLDELNSAFNDASRLANELNDEELKKAISNEKERWDKYQADVKKYERETNKSEDEKIADELVGKAVIYTSQKKYKAASLNLKQALEIYNANQSKQVQIWATGLMLTLDLLENRIQDAEAHYQTYVKLANELKDKEFLGLSHGAKALILEKKNEYSGAEKELKQAIDMLQGDVKTKKYESLFYTYMGSLRYKQHDLKQAISNYEKSLSAEKRFIEPKTVSFSNFMLGYFYLKQNNPSKAIEHLEQSLKSAEEIDEAYLKAADNILLAILEKDKSQAYLDQASALVADLNDRELPDFMAKYQGDKIHSEEAMTAIDNLVEKIDIYYRYEAV